LDFHPVLGISTQKITNENGAYSESEELEENIDGIIFGNSISSSDAAMTDGNFTLAFLEEGSYSLITALYIDNVFSGVVDTVDGIQVSTGGTTTVDVNTSDNTL